MRALVAVILVALGGSAARADSDEPALRMGGLAHAGMSTPYGLIGVSIDGVAYRHVGFGGGVGMNGEGLQLGAMVSAVSGGDRAFAIGAGLSTGPHRWSETVGLECDDFCDERVWDRATWVNVQLGYRHRFAGRWLFNPYLGLSLMTNGDDFECPDQDLCGAGDDGTQKVFVGVALGVGL